MATALQTTYDKQIEVQQRLNQFVVNYNKTPRDRFTVGHVIGRLTGLKEIWAEFVNNHKAIVSEASPEACSVDAYFVNNTYAACEEAYFDLFGRITQ